LQPNHGIVSRRAARSAFLVGVFCAPRLDDLAMNTNTNPSFDRRRLLFAAAALPAASLLHACAAAGRALRNPGGPEPTPWQEEGPFYRLFSTARPSLREPGLAGTALELTGRVLDKKGKPLANALLDFWQCDDAGVYDTRGLRLRGHQFTDAEGRYRLETIAPGRYPGRTRHIHVKLQPIGADLPAAPSMLNLTTQVYFPGDEGNAKDDLFDPALVVAMDQAGAGQLARFDFVLDLG
jgi:protocatechuate 3,4-dioxygenase beta subunit